MSKTSLPFPSLWLVLVIPPIVCLFGPAVKGAEFDNVAGSFNLVARPPIQSRIGPAVIGNQEMIIVSQGNYRGVAGALLDAPREFVDLTTWSGGNSDGGFVPVGEGIATLNANFVIQPGLGEAIGDPVDVYFHLVRSVFGNPPPLEGGLSTVSFRGHVGFDPPILDYDFAGPGTHMVTLRIGEAISLSTGSRVFLRGGHGPFYQDVHLQASFDSTPPPQPRCIAEACIPEPSGVVIAAVLLLCGGVVARGVGRRNTCRPSRF